MAVTEQTVLALEEAVDNSIPVRMVTPTCNKGGCRDTFEIPFSDRTKVFYCPTHDRSGYWGTNLGENTSVTLQCKADGCDNSFSVRTRHEMLVTECPKCDQTGWFASAFASPAEDVEIVSLHQVEWNHEELNFAGKWFKVLQVSPSGKRIHLRTGGKGAFVDFSDIMAYKR